MKNNLLRVAVCYDFDGTLAAGNMQEYGFMKRLQITPEAFWQKSDEWAKENNADRNLSYMKLMLDEAKTRHIAFRKEDFAKCGEDLSYFKGVKEWFNRVNAYALSKGIILEHYIISSGLEEILDGSEIAKEFKKMYACRFAYNEYGEAVWPARIVGYTEKTQYLFRINKGCLDPNDMSVNALMPKDERPVPFEHMIYFGDGETDIPSMSMVKRMGGYAVAVYQPRCQSSKARASQLYEDGRVNIYAPADYSENHKLDRYVKHVIDKIASDGKVKDFK